MMLVKQHLSKGRLVLAVCDKDVCGRRFEDKDLQLDVSKEFYGGDETSEQGLLALLHKAHVVNMVGRQAVDFALKNNLVKQESVLTIGGVPHAQCVFEQD